jgi:uncharacterized membrane protein YfcA
VRVFGDAAVVFGALSLAGGLMGAIVLIHTPARVFRIVAPGLMMSGLLFRMA